MSNKNKNQTTTDHTNGTEIETEANGGLTRDELSELLRYYIGNPIPYMQDGRYRDLYETFRATDDRPYTSDERTAPIAADDKQPEA